MFPAAEGLLVELEQLSAGKDAAEAGGLACHALADAIRQITEREGRQVPLHELSQEADIAAALRYALVPDRDMFDVLKAFLVRSPCLGYDMLSKRVSLAPGLQSGSKHSGKPPSRPWKCIWCLRRFELYDQLVAHVAARIAGAKGDTEHSFAHILGLIAATDPGRLPGISKWRCPLCPLRKSCLEKLLEHWSTDPTGEHDSLLILAATLLLRAAPPTGLDSLRHWAEGNGQETPEGLRELRMFLALTRRRRRLTAIEDLSNDGLCKALALRGVPAPEKLERSYILALLRSDLTRERHEKVALKNSRRRLHSSKGRIVKSRRVANLGSDSESVRSSSTGCVELDVNVEVLAEVITIGEQGPRASRFRQMIIRAVCWVR